MQSFAIDATEWKKDLTVGLKEALLDPFSSESLSQFKAIESLLIETHYHAGFSKEEEHHLLMRLSDRFYQQGQNSITLIKRNFQHVLKKRKILPKECFSKGKFLPVNYKKYLFKELKEKLHQSCSLISLCYHFAQEWQLACAILTGEHVDLDSTTLEFLTFIEHIAHPYKYPHLLIQDAAIIQHVFTLLHTAPQIDTQDLEKILENCRDYAASHDVTSCALSLIKMLKTPSTARPDLHILPRMDVVSAISFLKHFEALLKIFSHREQRIIELCIHYMDSLTDQALFFEHVTFNEISLIVNSLIAFMGPWEGNKKEPVVRELHRLIWAYKENPDVLKQWLHNYNDHLPVSSHPFAPFVSASIRSVSDIEAMLQMFFSFKKLALKKDSKKMIAALARERHLSILRISIEQIQSPLIKTVRKAMDCPGSLKERLMGYLKTAPLSNSPSTYIDHFYPLLS